MIHTPDTEKCVTTSTKIGSPFWGAFSYGFILLGTDCLYGITAGLLKVLFRQTGDHIAEDVVAAAEVDHTDFMP